MYSTNILLNLISTIFKTINSSVDDTRKTLALFNKDWNTYKTNWQKGFASNGFAGGVKSVFQSTKSVVSPEQIQMLRTWNNAVKHGCTNQETFNKIIANADHNTKMYFAGLNKGKGTLDGLKKAQNATKASTIGLTIAQTALNMAISMGLMAAIFLAIKGFDKMINHAKRASEAADEAFEETSSKVQEQQEELKTLDELISKYKELKKDGTLDIEGRKEVKELQNDIADLVGTQARNLDLVNGKLDDEIKKLDEISAKEAKTAYETATANYNNSQRTKKNATGDDSLFFFDGFAYTGKREKDAENILKEYGFGNNVRSGGFFGTTLTVRDDFDNDMNMLEGAQEKADYLQSMIDVLEQNGQRATELYSGLISQRDKYLNYIDNQQGAANTLVSSWITYSQYSNEELSKITVDSVESFETYRQKMIEAAKNDESVGKLLSDGTLSEKDLEVAVNDFMATSIEFSDWYKQWIGDVQGSTFDNKTTASLSELKSASDSISSLSSAFKELSDDGYITTETISKIQEETKLSGDEWETYKQKLLTAKKGSAEFSQVLSDLTYKILDAKFKKNGLVDATEEEIAAVLRENGVVNASAVAHEYATRNINSEGKAKAENAIQTAIESGEIGTLIKNLSSQATACGVSEYAFRQLTAQIIITSGTKLSVEQQIGALQQLGYAADVARSKISSVYSMKASNGILERGVAKTAYKDGYIYYYDSHGGVISRENIMPDMPDIPNITIPNYSGATKDSGGDSKSSPKEPTAKNYDEDTSYFSEVDAWIDEGKRQVENLEEERDGLNRQLENALESGNKDQAEIIRRKLAENAKAQKDALHTQNIGLRSMQNDLLYSLYQYAPELAGKAWDEISEVDLAHISRWFEGAVDAAERGVVDAENKKDRDVYNYEVANPKNDEGKTAVEKAGDEAVKAAKMAVSSAERRLNQVNGIIDDLKALDGAISDNSSSWWENDDEIKSNWESIIDNQDEYSNNWIENQKAYNKLSEEEELAAYSRMINNNKEFQNQILADTTLSEEAKLALLKKTNDIIVDLEQKSYQLSRDARWENSNDWIAERNRLGDWHLFNDSEVDAWKRVLGWLRTDYPNELDLIKEAEENLYNARRDQMDKELGDIDEYINARNTYNDWEDWADSEIQAIRRKMDIVEDYYKQGIISLEEYNDKARELEQSLYTTGKNAVVNAIEKMISDYEKIKNDEKEAIQELLEKEEDDADARRKSLEFDSSQANARHTLLKSYYDVINAIAEAQREITKELNASLKMYEYLDESSRKLLFNQEDYNALSKELADIEAEANELQRQYNEDILGASKENIAEITSQYQMQYETLMKSYEIAKADLEVAKKKQKLNNVLNERNVRMFINGQWQWVANTQDVINAQEELAEAEIEREQRETTLKQTESLNKLIEEQDKITTQINFLESDLEKIREMYNDQQEEIDNELDAIREKWSEMQDVLNGEQASLAEVLKDIKDVDAITLKDILNSTSEDLAEWVEALKESLKRDAKSSGSSSGGGSSGGGSYSGGRVLQVGADGNAPAGAKVGDTIKTSDGNYKIVAPGTKGANYNPASGHWSVKVYATGTRYTSPGNALMGEEGAEMFIKSNGHLVPINQPTFGNVGAGGIVFNQDQMDFARKIWDWSNIGEVGQYNLVNRSASQSIEKTIDNRIIINGMTVDTGSANGQALVDALKRYVGNH